MLKSGSSLGQGSDPVVGGKRDPHIGQSNLVAEKLEEVRQLTVDSDSHGLHLRRVWPDVVTEKIVSGKADNQTDPSSRPDPVSRR